MNLHTNIYEHCDTLNQLSVCSMNKLQSISNPVPRYSQTILDKNRRNTIEKNSFMQELQSPQQGVT